MMMTAIHFLPAQVAAVPNSTRFRNRFIGPKGRKKLAQGVSPGKTVAPITPSPGGATETLSEKFLPPLRGLRIFGAADRGLTPTANIFRPFRAGKELVVAGAVVKSMETSHGRKYIIDGRIVSPSGKNPVVRSVWIVRSDEDFARLTSCYVL